MKILTKISEEIVPLSSRQHFILLTIIACVFQFLLFYAPSLAEGAVTANLAKDSQVAAQALINGLNGAQSIDNGRIAQTTPPTANRLPAIPGREIKVIRESSHTITAYNSEAAQTDDSPCITANGFNVCQHGEEDTIAANFLPFGAKVKIPELFGDRVFVVRDRMNKRHASRVDIWMKDRQSAVKFGVKIAKIQVIE
jgi:3D (Asp-Asp-Asp) domain-containing protein